MIYRVAINELLFPTCKGATARETDKNVWAQNNLQSPGAKLWNDLSPILSNVGERDIYKSSLDTFNRGLPWPHLYSYIVLLCYFFVYSTSTCTYSHGLNYTCDEIAYLPLLTIVFPCSYPDCTYWLPHGIYFSTTMLCDSILANVVCFTCTALNKVYLILFVWTQHTNTQSQNTYISHDAPRTLKQYLPFDV